MGSGPKMIWIDWFFLAIQYCFAAHPSLPRSHESLVKFKVATWFIAKGWWKISELTQPRTTSDTDATHGLLGEIEMKGLKKNFSVAYTFHPRLFSWKIHLKEVCHKIFCFRFFHESYSHKPLKITWGSFQIFCKIWGDIHKSRCTTRIIDTGGKFSTSVNETGDKFGQLYQRGVIDTGGKFAMGVNGTARKFAADVNDTSGK